MIEMVVEEDMVVRHKAGVMAMEVEVNRQAEDMAMVVNHKVDHKVVMDHQSHHTIGRSTKNQNPSINPDQNLSINLDPNPNINPGRHTIDPSLPTINQSLNPHMDNIPGLRLPRNLK